MGYLLLIRKLFEKNSIHFYKVFKDNNLYEISYYIGLDEKNKKIYFFENEQFTDPACIYDINQQKFEMQDSQIFSLINGRVIAQAHQAFIKKDFPLSISWES